ncbi:MAG: hypothetical protein KIS86_12955 [Devosia sp.]|nr:hypothetical protein [Devosia sp.]
MRRAPQYHSPSIHPRAQLEPSGDHRLLVENQGNLVLAEYDLSQVAQLEAAIVEFKRLVTVTDGGRDFHNRRIVPIEVGR